MKYCCPKIKFPFLSQGEQRDNIKASPVEETSSRRDVIKKKKLPQLSAEKIGIGVRIVHQPEPA